MTSRGIHCTGLNEWWWFRAGRTAMMSMLRSDLIISEFSVQVENTKEIVSSHILLKFKRIAWANG